MIGWGFPDAKGYESQIRFRRVAHAEDFLGFCDSCRWSHRFRRIFSLDHRQDQTTEGLSIRSFLQYLRDSQLQERDAF